MRSLTAWITDVLLGPCCPLRDATGCDHRARGPRTLHHHLTTKHPTWEPT